MRKHPFLRALVALFLAVSVLFSLVGCTEGDFDRFLDDPLGYLLSLLGGSYVPSYIPKQVDGTLQVHFIDVGQGDAILILEGEHSMLIDTGDTDKANQKKLTSYLDALKIEKLDYLVLTHPDSDHIGGAPSVINKYEIGKCIMSNGTKTTKIFESTMDALEDQDVTVERGFVGGIYTLGDADLHVLAPNSDSYTDANDYSVVIKLYYGARSVLLTGDAHALSEEEILKSKYAGELDSDVLKVGHHGSRSSSSVAFLNAVTPTYAVISCGEGNSYGHPHTETLDALSDRSVFLYRTDTMGTVIMTTDGTSITFVTEKTLS